MWRAGWICERTDHGSQNLPGAEGFYLKEE